MSHLFVDLRPVSARAKVVDFSGEIESFFPGVRIDLFEKDEFFVVTGRVDRPELWAPFADANGETFVALGGRIALEDSEWEAASKLAGNGGLACKAIADAYRREGAKCFGRLNGNFAVFLHDKVRGQSYLATDRCGVFLMYGNGDGGLVFGSHPDLAARLANVQAPLDHLSMAEFLASGRLTYPFTYYQHIRAVEFGSVHSFKRIGGTSKKTANESYWEWRLKTDEPVGEDDLAEELAHAFQNSVKRRTLRRLGKVAVGLSGGLDSRVILACATGGAEISAFSLLDEENDEWRIAKSIAETCGVPIHAVRRDYDYYGRFAAEGVRISGGMGSLMSNHYLGIRETLREWDIENLLTGCYIDYVFKGLGLNTREHPITRRETFAQFEHSFYRPQFPISAQLEEELRQRLRSRYPFPENSTLSDAEWGEVERRRVFPLAYEADSAQRVVPQRVMPWFVPIADNDLLDVHCRIPPRVKLNNRLFRKMVLKACNSELCRIPDNNTGAPVNAGATSLLIHRYRSAFSNRIRKSLKPGISTRGSWPNWEYYVQNSPMIAALWRDRRDETKDLFSSLLGYDPFDRSISEYRGTGTEYFLRILTLKLWFEQSILRTDTPSVFAESDMVANFG